MAPPKQSEVHVVSPYCFTVRLFIVILLAAIVANLPSLSPLKIVEDVPAPLMVISDLEIVIFSSV